MGKGLTASQIADELGGVSRNAVIGKAHRLGLKSRPSPVKATDKPVKAPAPKAAAPAAPKPAAAPAAPRAAAPAAPRPAAAPPKAEPKPVAADASAPDTDAPSKPDAPRIVSIGPGGFIRQGPGDQQAPIPPAPPRRLVPAKPSPEIADKTSLLDLNDRICRWPMGHPGEPDFHFCGEAVNPGFPIASNIADAPIRRNCRADAPPAAAAALRGPRVR